jgi:hypothetical protein
MNGGLGLKWISRLVRQGIWGGRGDAQLPKAGFCWKHVSANQSTGLGCEGHDGTEWRVAG